MNSYLSRAEKETFVRLTSLAGLQELIIATYADGKNADKEFLKLLRTSKTWLMKALDYRTSFLDEAAAYDLARQVSKLDLIFVPNDKARKEYELLKEVRSHVHMPMEDFEDWYSEVIEHTCKTCARKDYKSCAMRRVMAKHGVYPVNPGAKETCQFSYVDVDPSELPPPRPPREIVENEPDGQQVADCLPPEPEMAVQENVEGKEPEQELVPYTGHGAAKRIKASNVSVEIYMASGAQLALEVPRNMAEQLIKGMKSLPKNNRPVCAYHVGNELIAVDTQEVSVFRAYGIGECFLQSNGNMNAIPHRNTSAGNQNAVSYRGELAAYKIECRCGAEYVVRLGADRAKAYCNECKETVYRDDTVTEPLDSGGEATLMTNRYFVPQAEKSRELPAKKVHKYRDPCRIFD